MKNLATRFLGFVLVIITGPWAHSAPPPRWPQMPYILTEPGPEHAASARMFQCVMGIEVAPNGRLWATWDSGGYGEGEDNFILLSTSGDGGRTWSKPVLIVDPPFRASYSMLWLDPGGRLWFTFNLWPIRKANEDEVGWKEKFPDIQSYQAFVEKYNYRASQFWAMTTDRPGEATPAWSEPRLIAMEVAGHMNKPIALANGTWVWPTAATPRLVHPHRPLFSADQGKTFHFRGDVPIPPSDRNFDENIIVERKDGSLWMLDRTNYGIGESFSFDEGKTWTTLQPSSIAHTIARFYVRRLQSGKLLLVKHGEIDAKHGRKRLMAHLSDDDGKTWYGGLMLEERECSYPDGTQGKDGMIYVIYDHERHRAKEILMAAFTEEDVAAGKIVSGTARLQVLVDKATAHNPRHEKSPGPVKTTAVPESPMLTEPGAVLEAAEGEIRKLTDDALIFSDRTYRFAALPNALKGRSFVFSSMQKTTALSRKAGVVYALTPRPQRNARGSLEMALLEKGFSKVATPEFNLFPGDANICSVYQKRVEAEERIELGFWGMLVF